MRNLIELAEYFKPQLLKIKCALFDADGVLTDGKIYYIGEEQNFLRSFHTQDGLGIRLLKKNGIDIGVISGGSSPSLKKRLEMLKMDYVYLGNEDKRSAYLDVLKRSQLKHEEILYMGDDVSDIPLLHKVGFAVSMNHAPLEVKAHAHYIANANAGIAAVREVIDLLKFAKGFNFIPDDFEKN